VSNLKPLASGDVALLDVEGTTTPIAFVKETLFPYARKRMADFVMRHASEPKVAEQIAAVAKELGAARPDPAAAVHALLQWADADRKVTPLKQLQGMIWRQGYESGELKGPVFDDAEEALRAWKKRGVRVFIYSSGSVEAQKLLFRYSDRGDLLPLIEGHFDTTVGGKLEAKSYAAIAERIGIAPGRVLFLSDHVGEVRASAEAGMQGVRVLRPGEVPPVNDAWTGATVATFTSL
jgi:enolase-phosphatase E1